MEHPNYFDDHRVNGKMLRARKSFEIYDKFVCILNLYTYSTHLKLLDAH